MTSDRESRAARRPVRSASSQPVTSGVSRPVRRRPVVKPSAGGPSQGSVDPVTGSQRVVAPQPATSRATKTSATTPNAAAPAAQSAAVDSAPSVDFVEQQQPVDAEWRLFLAKPAVVLSLRIVFAALVVAIPVLLGFGMFDVLPTGWSVLAVAGAIASWYGLRAGLAEQQTAASTSAEEQDADEDIAQDEPQQAVRPPVRRRRVAFVDHGVAVTAPSAHHDNTTQAPVDAPADTDADLVESIVETDHDDDESAVVGPQTAESRPGFLPDGDLVPVDDGGVNASRVARPTPSRGRRAGAYREWQPTPLPRPLYQLRQGESVDDDIAEAELPAPRPAITGSIQQVPPAHAGTGNTSQTPTPIPSGPSSSGPVSSGAGRPGVGPSRYDGANGARVTEQTIAVSAPAVDDLDDEELTEHTAAVRRRGRTERRVSLDLDSVLQQRRRASGE